MPCYAVIDSTRDRAQFGNCGLAFKCIQPGGFYTVFHEFIMTLKSSHETSKAYQDYCLA